MMNTVTTNTTNETPAITHKPIPEIFNKKGYTYRQVKREGNKAIYEQTRGSFVAYEVVKIGKHNGYSMGGAYIEPSETYPGSSLWGILGWTCTTLDDAQKRYDSIEV
ncbi:MAG: hypothetical protein EBS53_17625 [Bacteroidetes bacterium]|nr:hypothetical protein [Bacteroidota bacterium]